MKTFKEYGVFDRDCGFNDPIERAEIERSYYCYSVHRDSDYLTQSNFDFIRAALHSSFVFRFNHWLYGWIDYLGLPHDALEVEKNDFRRIIDQLENYPILDEEDYSRRCHNAIVDFWRSESISGRVELCQRYDDSIFAARSDYPPSGVYDGLSDSGDFS